MNHNKITQQKKIHEKMSMGFFDSNSFIALAAEVNNSSASNPDYMEEHVWPVANELKLNTILVPVYWELVEAEEGKYDFSIAKEIIDQARKYDKKLIFLWFGLWKNGLSTYVPSWMKVDNLTYPHARDKDNGPIYSITPFSKEAVEKDARAFKQLMRFLKEYDLSEKTVIMIQIENEIGLLGTDFDYQETSLKKLQNMVPEEVENFSKKKGTWEEVFEDDAKEMLLAYTYAKAVDLIADSGKQEYDLPMFVNAWIEKYPNLPGEYPAGGPIERLIPFWRHVTHNLVAFAPDIYVSNYHEVADGYMARQDILLVPETRQDRKYVISNLFYSIASHNLFCYAPFALERFSEDVQGDKKRDINLLTTLSIDQEAFNPSGSLSLLSKVYEILGSMMEMIIEKRNEDRIFGFLKKFESHRGESYATDNAFVKVKYNITGQSDPLPSGFIIQGHENELFISGVNFSISLESDLGNVGIIDLEEGVFENSIWKRKRVLNGDERYFINFDSNPKLVRLVYHIYT